MLPYFGRCRVIYNLGESLGQAGTAVENGFSVREHENCAKKLRLNHYVTKSREEFLEKYVLASLTPGAHCFVP